MPILLRGVRLNLDEPEDLLPVRAAKRLGVPVEAIRHYAVARRALDARRKSDIHFLYQMEISLDGSPAWERRQLGRLRAGQGVFIEPIHLEPPTPGQAPLRERPIIIGFGPGGIFAALKLAEYGYRPLVLERGREVKRRHRDVLQRFYREGDFDPSSNLLFGEGGAGTYSDGKLFTRIGDPLTREVLEVFYRHGADPDILISARPHIGSDKLPTICTRIRKRIESLGGEIRFEHQVDDVRCADGRLTALHLIGDGVDAGGEWIDAGPTILAIGHSARDTVRMLAERGVTLEPKPFQIGVRIEHRQEMVDQWQYRSAAGHAALGAAEYSVVAKGRGGPGHSESASLDVFSFCMCPGGIILPSNESAGLIVTNGASGSQRLGLFANAGLVITMDPEAMGLDALGGIAYQEKWERRAYEATRGTYKVPAQRASDFLAGVFSNGTLKTSYPLGGEWADIHSLVPSEVTLALGRALTIFESRMPGFAGSDAIITAPETRASAPIRILRDHDSREAVGVENLYPVGEGAGYAGGIVSAAVDGIRTAEAIIRRFAPLS